jgi:hypothetical protein
LAWSIATAIAGGGSFHTYKNTTPRKVLYLDGEMDGEDAQERLKTCITATNSSPDVVGDNLMFLSRQMQEFNSVFPDLNNLDWQINLISCAKELGVEFIVLDNFSTLAEIEDENSAAAFNGITDFLLRLKQAGLAGLLVHHSNKADSGYRGSQKLSVTFELIVSLKRPETAVGSGCSFDLIIEKTRSQVDTTPVQLILGEFGWTEGESDVAIAKVLRLIKTGKYQSQKDLAAALGVSKGYVSKLVTSAIKAGHITREEMHGYFARAQMEDFADDAEIGVGDF